MSNTYDGTYDGWQSVLDAYGTPAPQPHVRLSGGRLGDQVVTVVVSVDSEAPAPVDFPDNLYGATAWAPVDGSAGPPAGTGGGVDRTRWQRVDTAEMRLMIAPMLAPGAVAEIKLPLAATPPSVRVLLARTWLDISP